MCGMHTVRMRMLSQCWTPLQSMSFPQPSRTVKANDLRLIKLKSLGSYSESDRREYSHGLFRVKELRCRSSRGLGTVSSRLWAG